MFYPEAILWHEDENDIAHLLPIFSKSFSFCQFSSFIWCFHISFRLLLVSYWWAANFQNYGKCYYTGRIKLYLQMICKPHWAVEASTFAKDNAAFSVFSKIFTWLTVIDFCWKHLLRETSFLLLPKDSQERGR